LAVVTSLSYTSPVVKPTKNIGKLVFGIGAIQEPVFSVANTGFEGGDNGHGYGDCIFLVIYAQPSHAVQ
jgi:hypothetical protein